MRFGGAWPCISRPPRPPSLYLNSRVLNQRCPPLVVGHGAAATGLEHPVIPIDCFFFCLFRFHLGTSLLFCWGVSTVRLDVAIVLAVRWHKARGRMCNAVQCYSPFRNAVRRQMCWPIEDQLHPLPRRCHAVQYVGARSTPHRCRAVQSVGASSTPPIPKPISLPPRTRAKCSLFLTSRYNGGPEARQAARGRRLTRPDQVDRSLPPIVACLYLYVCLA